MRVDTKSRVIARILGARQLSQAALSGFRPSPEVLAMGVWVDTVHALTALGLALVDGARARAGLTDTAIAGLWATAGYRDLTRGRATPPAHQRRRDQLAVLVLTHAPAGVFCERRSTKIGEISAAESSAGCPNESIYRPSLRLVDGACGAVIRSLSPHLPSAPAQRGRPGPVGVKPPPLLRAPPFFRYAPLTRRCATPLRASDS